METDWSCLARELQSRKGETGSHGMMETVTESDEEEEEMALRGIARENWLSENSERRKTKKWECSLLPDDAPLVCSSSPLSISTLHLSKS